MVGHHVSLQRVQQALLLFSRLIQEKKTVVGLNLNANHIKTTTSGYVFACAKPLHIGKSTSIWDVKITNDEDELVSNITFTAMHKDLRKKNNRKK